MIVNLNDVAKSVTITEGMKISINNGQTKEIIRLFIDELTNNYELYEIIMCLRKHGSIDGLDKKSERKALKDFLEEKCII